MDDVYREADRVKAGFAARIACWEDTRAVASLLAPPPRSVKVRLDPDLECEADFETTEVTVVDRDCLDCALELGQRPDALDPLVLNLADDYTPGGSVDLGSGAQEESLFRRTNLCMTLAQDPRLYPIQDDEGIYSPDVLVFKEAEERGWARMAEPRKVTIMSVPGVRYPALCSGRMSHEDEARLRVKIRTMLQIGYLYGHSTLVLGASGCGAWRCPAPQVAAAFKETIAEFRGVFARIVFAVKRGGGRYGDNFEAFRSAFHPERENETEDGRSDGSKQ